MSRIQGVGQAVQLGHLLEWRQQAEADNIEQCHCTAGDVIDAVTADHILDYLRFHGMPGKCLAQRQVHGLDVQQPRNFLHLREIQLAIAGNQFCDERRRDPWWLAVCWRRCVLGNCVMRHDQDKYAFIQSCPAENVVLAQ